MTKNSLWKRFLFSSVLALALLGVTPNKAKSQNTSVSNEVEYLQNTKINNIYNWFMTPNLLSKQEQEEFDMLWNKAMNSDLNPFYKTRLWAIYMSDEYDWLSTLLLSIIILDPSQNTEIWKKAIRTVNSDPRKNFYEQEIKILIEWLNTWHEIIELKKIMSEQEKTMSEQEKTMSEQEKTMSEQEKTMSEQEKTMSEQEKLIKTLNSLIEIFKENQWE